MKRLIDIVFYIFSFRISFSISLTSLTICLLVKLAKRTSYGENKIEKNKEFDLTG